MTEDASEEEALLRAEIARQEIVRRLPTLTVIEIAAFYKAAVRRSDGALIRTILDETAKRGLLVELQTAVIALRETPHG